MSTNVRKNLRLCLALLVPSLLAAAPANAGMNRWTPFSPGGGSVEQVIASPGALYALVNGAPFKSEDRGMTWRWSGLGLPPQLTGRLAIDPSHPDHLYLADSFRGIFHSADGGRTWANVHAQSLGMVVALVPAPAASLVLYLATDEAVYRSKNGGVWWERVFQTEGRITSVAADLQTIGTVYVSLTGREDGLFRSLDGGDVWEPILSDGGVTGLVAAPSRPGRLFLTQGSSVRASRDAGATWTEGASIPSGATALAVDPFDADTLYAGGPGLAVSRDGGAIWTPLNADLPWCWYGTRILALACDPIQPGTLYAGFQWMGVLASLDRGSTWQHSDLKGMSANFVRRIRFAPGSPQTMYLILEGSIGDAVRTLDGGRTWSHFGEPLETQGPMIDLIHHPLYPKVIYALAGGFESSALFRSPDRGKTWRRIGPAPLGVIAFSRGALLSAGQGIWRSADGGRTWSEVLSARVSDPGCSGPLCQSRYVFDLITHRGDPTTVYARTYVYSDGSGSTLYYEVFQSRDGGLRWRRLQTQRDGVAVASASAATVYLAQANDLLGSTDGGRKWNRVGSLPEGTVIQDLIVDPFDPQTLYAATAAQGIQRSSDGGVTWSPLNRGELARRQWLWTWRISAHPEIPGHLYALPFSHGVFEMQLTEDIVAP